MIVLVKMSSGYYGHQFDLMDAEDVDELQELVERGDPIIIGDDLATILDAFHINEEDVKELSEYAG